MCNQCTGRPVMSPWTEPAFYGYDVREHIPAAFSGTVPVITSVR